MIQVEDGTSSALLVCQDSNQVKQIFKLSPEEWLELENQSKCKGELLYLSSGKEKSENSSTFEAQSFASHSRTAHPRGCVGLKLILVSDLAILVCSYHSLVR